MIFNAWHDAGRPIIALVGPTASGKTGLGVALAQRLGMEIINADSMQVYRGMDIGTAKPTDAERKAVPFHIIDVVDPDGDWTLSQFQERAVLEWNRIVERGMVPIIVGGTGLYVRSLTTDLRIPAVPRDPEIRRVWTDFAEEFGNSALHQRAYEIDPVAAAKVHVNDLHRLTRILEVHSLTGERLSDLHARNAGEAAELNVLLIGLDSSDRRRLYSRIEARVDEMMAAGFLDEVCSLTHRGYDSVLSPMRSLGYEQLADVLQNKASLGDAVVDIKRETRHFARRQLIWFRADKRIHWVDIGLMSPDDIASDIELYVRRKLSNSKGSESYHE